MAIEVPHIVKEHPVATVAIVGAGALALFLIFNAQSAGAATASAGGVSADAALAYQAQQDQLSAAANAQNSSQSFQLTAQSQDLASKLALLIEQDKSALSAQSTAAQVTNNQNQLQYQLGESQISAQLAGLQSNNATSVSLAQITAGEQEAIANTNANVAIQQSNNATTVAVTQSHDYASVEKTISNNNTASSIVGGLFGFLGGLF